MKASDIAEKGVGEETDKIVLEFRSQQLRSLRTFFPFMESPMLISPKLLFFAMKTHKRTIALGFDFELIQ